MYKRTENEKHIMDTFWPRSLCNWKFECVVNGARAGSWSLFLKDVLILYKQKHVVRQLHDFVNDLAVVKLSLSSLYLLHYYQQKGKARRIKVLCYVVSNAYIYSEIRLAPI